MGQCRDTQLHDTLLMRRSVNVILPSIGF